MADGKILVTGATGFVGPHLCRLLAGEGRAVRVAMRPIERAEGEGERVVVSDLSATTDWRDALVGIDAVVHLAGYAAPPPGPDPLAELRRVNVDGTAALARACVAAGVRRLVLVSSVKVHGEASDRIYTERDTPAPRDPYAVSKLEAEQAVREAAAGTSLQVVIVRPPVVYGAGVKGNIRRLLGLVYHGIPLPLASAVNRRSMVGVRNLGHMLARSVDSPAAAGETFLVRDPEDLSTPELVRRLAALMRRPCRLFPFPVSALRLLGRATRRTATIERLVGSMRVDASKAETVLPWTPPYTVDEELRELVAWYLSERARRAG